MKKKGAPGNFQMHLFLFKQSLQNHESNQTRPDGSIEQGSGDAVASELSGDKKEA
ncbi:hypothetical protein [Desulfosediminicola sp.]|uniref:hypothetical protein n=1 Tax=Desulfosediminicola sp. TaxID=2886825 RepID=UPI003AF2FD1B